ncbi:MAG: hypothetical protein OEQ16_11155, partial [Gammaproteobacteria bacterium]|nr:hypothetical protein [Gammaproteobacteria bacterium]
PPETSASYKIDLPIQLAGGISGLETNDVAIRASGILPTGPGDMVAFLQGMDIQFENFDQLFELRGISLDQLLDAISSGLDALIRPDGILSKKIPGINQSLNELLGEKLAGDGQDFLTQLKDVIDAARDNDLDTVADALNDGFNTLFDTTDDPIEFITITYEDSRILLDFSFDQVLASIDKSFSIDLKEYADQLGLIDLATDLGFTSTQIDDLLSKVTIGDSAIPLQANIEVGVDFGIGLDLSDVIHPIAFIASDSGIYARIEGGTSDVFDFDVAIDLSALGIGNVGFAIDDGMFEFGLDARFGLSEKDDGLYILGTDTLNPEFSIGGDFDINLPLVFGTLPVGGSALDGDGDGLSDNVLSLKGEFGETFSVDVLGPKLDDLFSLGALLNDPQTVLSGLEGMFDGIRNQIQSNIDSVKLPLVGDNLDGASAFVDDLEQKLLGAANADGKYYVGADEASGYLPTLGGYLQNAIDNNLSTFDGLIDKLKVELWNAFGTPGLDILKVIETDPVTGAVLFNADGTVKYRDAANADDVALIASSSGIQFNVLLADEVFPDIDIPIDFAAAFPGFELKTDPDATITLAMDYIFGLGIGLSSDDGLYIDTSGVTATGEELAMMISATIPDETELSATLFFLQATLTEFPDGKDSGLFGKFSIDLQDAGNDGRWSIFGESLGVEARLVAFADADFNASIQVGSDSFALPDISAVIRYDQTFADIRLSTAGGASTDFSGSAVIVFEDVTLDLGQAINDFVAPLFDTIAEIITPIEPLIDLLLTPIDLGITELRLLDLARLKLSPSQFAAAENALEAIQSTIDFVETISNVPDDETIMINFGTFTLGGNQLSGDSTAVIAPDSGTQPDLDQGSPAARDVTNQFGTTKGSFRFPILQDPTSVFGLLMGQNIDLFIFDLPQLNLNFEYVKSYPVFPGLNARIGGKISATTNFSFGFDTTGLRAWAEDEDFNPFEIDRIFEGFFVDDHGIEDTDSDEPEATIMAGLVAGASLGLSGLVEAGVDGGVEAEITFDLNDLPNPGTGPGTLVPEQYDGKLRVDEIITRLEQDPLCLFDTEGDLTVFLEAFLWVGLDLGFSEITLFEARERFVDEVLARFDHECPPPEPPNLSRVVGNELYLINEDPAVPGVAKTDRAHGHRVELGYIDNSTPDAPKFVIDPTNATHLRVKWGDFSDLYLLSEYSGNAELVALTGEFDGEVLSAPITNISAVGTSLNDRYTFGSGLDGISIDVDTKDGDDRVIVLSGNDITIVGGLGDDTIRVAATVKGAISVSGLGGNDDIALVTPEDESLVSYVSSLLDGGDDNDRITGSTLGDVIRGGDGRDTILGLAGNDTIWGYSAQTGGTSDDKDKIDAGAGADIVFGGGGDDR